jgi:carbonic anhydrase
MLLLLYLGSHTWAVNYPLAAGAAQSPINIVRTSAEYDKDLEDTPLQFQYTGDDGYTVVNTGESFKVDLKHNSGMNSSEYPYVHIS